MNRPFTRKAASEPQIAPDCAAAVTQESGRATVPVYSFRQTDCDACNGSGEVHHNWSDGHPNIIHCCECIRGKMDAACCSCGNVLPLNDEGECQRCNDAGELPAELFHARYPSGWLRAELSALEKRA